MDSFAFIIHPLDPKADVARKYPRLARVLSENMIHFLSRYWPPVRLSRVRGVRSVATGREVEGWLLACPLTARQLLRLPTRVAYRKIIETGRLAEQLGASILGLGAFTSVAGDGGVTVARALDVPVTTGDSYTAALAVGALMRVGARAGIAAGQATVAIVGATGAIGSAVARLLAPQVGRLVLVGRNPRRLEQVGAAIAKDVELVLATDIDAIRTAHLVVSCTSAGRPIIFPEHLAPGALVYDVAQPHDVSIRVAKERADVTVIDGGVVETPPGVDFGFNYGLPPHLTFGCMAETMALALEGRFEDYTVGKDLRLEQVQEIEEIATRHGFRPVDTRSFGRAIKDARVEMASNRLKQTTGRGPA